MKKIFLLVLSIFYIFSLNVYADEDKYIVTMSENTDSIILMNAEETEVLNEELNMYLTTKENAEFLKRTGRALTVEKDVPVVLFSSEYNDTYFDKQWEYDSIEIYETKKALNTGNSTRVAVVDTGVYREHEDLVGAKIEEGYNYVHNSTDTTDTTGHGTYVTGLMLAQENNSIGIAGIAPNSTVVPLVVMANVTNEEGKLVSVGSSSMIIRALTDSVDKYNCKVINMSVGVETNLTSVRNAVKYAVSKGAIIVCAVGNEGKTEYTYPAAYEDTIGVGSVDKYNNVTSFSRKNDSVDVVAPGNNLYLLNNKGGYSSGAGTSFTTPIVSSYAALLCQKYPDLTYDEFLNIIKAGTMAISDDYSGYGIINFYEGLKFYESRDDVFVSPTNGNIFKYYIKTTNPVIRIRSNIINNKLKDFDYLRIVAQDNLYTENITQNYEENETSKVYCIDSFDKFIPVSNLRIIR